jgi:hypothetical protein
VSRPRSDPACALALALGLACTPGAALAKEPDQFTDRADIVRYYAGGYRQIPGAPGPSQIDALLDARMNLLLRDLERKLRSDPPRDGAERHARLRAAFQHRFVPELVTPYEEWIKRASGVPMYQIRDKGVYGHAVDYDDMRMAWYIELSPISMLAGVLIGIDKLGHFLAQGFQYFEKYAAMSGQSPTQRAAAVVALGHAQESGQLGVQTGGVYSFADLAANWDGMLFFLALFDDIDVGGERHARYFARDASGRFALRRDFHWAEWVKPDWDEAHNPSRVASASFYRKLAHNFWLARPLMHGSRRPSICQSYRADEAAFLGARRDQPGRALAVYALPEQAALLAPYVLDVRVLCRTPP